MSLEPEQRAEINVALQPMVTGNSSWLVSVVDPAASSAERLLRRLLVTAAVPNPNVARTYEAALVRPNVFYNMFTGRSTDHQRLWLVLAHHSSLQKRRRCGSCTQTPTVTLEPSCFGLIDPIC
jgi:hypothetical protein